jgi:hypothetical protein
LSISNPFEEWVTHSQADQIWLFQSWNVFVFAF